MCTIIELMCVNDIDLNVLNIEGKYALEVIELDQRILDAWQFALSISGGDLKLDKCSWTIQEYYWKKASIY